MKNYIVIVTALLMIFLQNSPLFSQGRLDLNTVWHDSSPPNFEQGRAFTHLVNARLALRNMDYETALVHADNAVAQNQGIAESYMVRAEIRHRMGMVAEAAEDITIAQRLNPLATDIYGVNGSGGIINTIYFQPKEFIIQANPEESLEYYKRKYLLLKKDQGESHPEFIALVNKLLISDVEEWVDMIPRLNSLIIQYPQWPELYDLKGWIFTELGLWEEALDALSKSVSVEPRQPFSWYNLARYHLNDENQEMALKHLNAAISIDEELSILYFTRAALLKKMGDNKAAIKDYDKIIAIDEWHIPESYVNRGLAHKATGNYVDALNDINMAIELFPDLPFLYKNRGNLYLVMGMPQEALIDYSEAINIDDSFAEAYFNRAIVKIILLNNASACGDLNTAKSLGFDFEEEFESYFCIR